MVFVRDMMGRGNNANSNILMINTINIHIKANSKKSLISSHSFLKYAISEATPRTNRVPPNILK